MVRCLRGEENEDVKGHVRGAMQDTCRTQKEREKGKDRNTKIKEAGNSTQQVKSIKSDKPEMRNLAMRNDARVTRR